MSTNESITKRVRAFFRRLRSEAVLVLAGVAALLSSFLVPPNAHYAEYIDLRVLCLLFCLMLVVAGMRCCGVFEVLAQRLLRGQGSLRRLQLVLVGTVFFSSMLITNDVALITFVPFTILVLQMAHAIDRLLWLVVLQTVAANLGSMAMPVGNPQNLFLCSVFNLTVMDFFKTLLPYTLLSLAGLAVAAAWVKNRTVNVVFGDEAHLREGKLLGVMGVLFVLCLLAVFRVLHYGVLTLVVVLAVAFLRPSLFRQVDVGLLLTFVFFFIFAGNMGELEAVRSLLAQLMAENALLTSAMASQVISNVPSAVLLAGFTEDWRGLLLGVDLGGLGTPIASLASLIAMRYYFAVPGAQKSRFLLVFSVVNVLYLVVLLALASL